MNQKIFLAIAIILNIVLLFMYIQKQSLLIELRYKKQRYEKKLNLVMKEKEELLYSLQNKKNYENIARKAAKKGMKKRRLKKVHLLSKT